MYETFYKLSSDPFRLLPDSGICFAHRSGAKAWAYLRYALKRGEGIVVVTGPPGSGKTTLAQRLLSEVNPSKIISVRLVANDLSATDLLRKLAYNLGLPVENKDRAMLSLMLERHLVEIEHSQRRILVVIDEAQTLSHQSLEAVRLLTDVQSRTHPVLQLVLFGQEELEGVMSAPGMEQFQQRVIASCRLQAMDLKETKAYLEYRLAAADWRGDPSVNGPAVMAVYRYSHGVPRHVNKILSRLLLHGSSEEKHALNDRDVMTVVGDLRSELLAPAADEVSIEAAPAGALSSIYELALVPSINQRRPPDVGPVALGGSDTALTGSAGALRMGRSPVHAGRRQSAYPDGYGNGRYMFRVGHRYEGGMRRRVVRALGRWRIQFFQMISNSHRITQRVRRLFRHFATRLRTMLGDMGTHARVNVARLRELARRPVYGQPAGLFAGAASVVLAVGVFFALNGSDRHDNGLTGDVDASGLVNDLNDSLMSDGILADSTGYVRLVDIDPQDLFGATSAIGTLMAGDFLTGEPAKRFAVQDIVGSAAGAGIVSGADERLSAGSHASNRSQFINSIADETTRQLLSAAGRYENSLIVWSFARQPEVVTDRGAVVWSMKQETDGPSKVPGMAIKMSQADAAADDGTTVSVTAQAAEVAAIADTGTRESDNAVTVPVETPDVAPVATIADSVAEGAEETELDGVESGTAIIVPDRERSPYDLPRYLPATAAGNTQAQTDVTGQALEIEVTETREDAAIDGAAIDAGQPDGAEAIGTGQVAMLTPSTVVDIRDASASEPVGESTEDVMSQPAADAARAEQRRSAEIAELLTRANKAIAANRLLMPQNRSAYSYLQRVLAIDSGNPDARRGMDRIVARYAELAMTALKEEAYDDADRFAGRGLRVQPNNRAMLALSEEIGIAREEAAAVALAEAEMARLAAEVKEVEPPPPPPPPPPKPSAFRTIMQLVEGI